MPSQNIPIYNFVGRNSGPRQLIRGRYQGLFSSAALQVLLYIYFNSQTSILVGGGVLSFRYKKAPAYKGLCKKFPDEIFRRSNTWILKATPPKWWNRQDILGCTAQGGTKHCAAVGETKMAVGAFFAGQMWMEAYFRDTDWFFDIFVSGIAGELAHNICSWRKCYGKNGT